VGKGRAMAALSEYKMEEESTREKTFDRMEAFSLFG